MDEGVQTVIIHIGCGKTGTTALQRYLSQNRDALQRSGIYYPAAAGGASGIGHDTFGKAFITSKPWYMIAPQGVDEALNAMRDEICQTRLPNILISSEQLELADPDLVRDFFGAASDRFQYKIIYFVRSQDELAESQYNQLVKLRGLNCSFRQYSQFEFDGNFLARAQSWQTAFDEGSVHCPIYAAHNTHIGNTLFSYLDGLAQQPPQSDAPAANASLGYISLTVARLLNIIDVEQTESSYDFAICPPFSADFPALFFNSDEAKTFRESFAHINKVLTKCFTGEEKADLGGRRYSDSERDAIREQIGNLRLDRL